MTGNQLDSRSLYSMKLLPCSAVNLQTKLYPFHPGGKPKTRKVIGKWRLTSVVSHWECLEFNCALGTGVLHVSHVHNQTEILPDWYNVGAADRTGGSILRIAQKCLPYYDLSKKSWRFLGGNQTNIWFDDVSAWHDKWMSLTTLQGRLHSLNGLLGIQCYSWLPQGPWSMHSNLISYTLSSRAYLCAICRYCHVGL